MKIRLVPVEQIFDRFPRMVRDLCASLEKEVELVIDGQGIELDRTVLDAITDPLLHILRNAIDHGMEKPEERESSGKPRTGRVKLTASRIGEKVSIAVTDDGRGIDLDRVKTKAIENKVISEQSAKSMSDEDIIALVGTPGLSTASKVTDVSGRGVGMDVVFRKIESVGGQVKITTEKNRGTSITLTIPISLAIIEGLLVRVAEEKYIIPISNVVAIMSVEPDDIKLINDKRVVTFREQIVPLLDVARLLGAPPSNRKIKASKITAVLIEKNGRAIGLVVDAVQSKQDIVLKRLDKAGYSSAAAPSEATILSNGGVALILDSNQF